MKRPVISGTLWLVAPGAVVLFGMAAHARLPYLPLTGPPEMRWGAIASPSPLIARLETPPAPVATNPPVAVKSQARPADTNPTDALDSTPAAPRPQPVKPADNSGNDAMTGPVFELPTPDLLGITPEMLASYFRPVQTGTNFIPLTGEFHVSFLPPLPPDTSSHARYTVK